MNKTIRLYTVEWIAGYGDEIEHEITFERIESWFEDCGLEDVGRINEYRAKLDIVGALPIGSKYELVHGMGETMRITATHEFEQGYCQIEDGAVYECYYPKLRHYWNGWACPAGLTAKSLCDFLAVSLEGRDNPADLELCTELLTSIEEHQYGDITLFSVGDGLVWEECTAEGDVDDDDDSWEGRCGDCHSYGQRGTTCNNCKRGIYSRGIA